MYQCFTGMTVSSGLFGLTKHGDHVTVNISQLEAPNDAVVMEYLVNMTITVAANNTAYLDYQSLCNSSSNMPTAVRDAINGIVPIEPVCGKCGKD